MQQTLSTSALIKTTVIAALLACIIFISFILPAEYNIDPTGVGAKLGLTVLATSTSVDKTASAPVVDIPPYLASGNSSDTIELVVPAGQGIEYKFAMQQFEKMEYEWLTDGEALYFDLHGEPQGDTTGYYESYAVASLNEIKGSFTAPFTGSHGWYWKNKSDKPVAVQLLVTGRYSILGLKK